jgi:hypothetical protein
MLCCQSFNSARAGRRLFNSSRALWSKNVILLILKSDALEAEKSEGAELHSFSEHCCKNKRVSADITRTFGIYEIEW